MYGTPEFRQEPVTTRLTLTTPFYYPGENGTRGVLDRIESYEVTRETGNYTKVLHFVRYPNYTYFSNESVGVMV